MALYKEIWVSFQDNTIVGYLHTENNSTIPIIPGNIDYQELQAWIALGNTPDPAYTQSEIDALQNEADRIQDIEDEQNGSGMIGLTVDEAKQIVIDRFDTVRLLPESNLTEIQAKILSLIDQTEWLFKKVVIFLLK